MAENKENYIPPEEGDLNTEAIKKGLTPEEEKYLRKDLESMESGHSSSDADPAAEEGDSFHKDWEIGNERAGEAVGAIEMAAGSFQKFLNIKGYTETEFSYEDIYDYLERGEVGGPTTPLEQKKEKTNKLNELKIEWQAGLERDEDGRVVYQL